MQVGNNKAQVFVGGVAGYITSFTPPAAKSGKGFEAAGIVDEIAPSPARTEPTSTPSKPAASSKDEMSRLLAPVVEVVGTTFFVLRGVALAATSKPATNVYAATAACLAALGLWPAAAICAGAAVTSRLVGKAVKNFVDPD